MHVKFERVINSVSLMDLNTNFAFDLETENGQGQRHRVTMYSAHQGIYACEVERVIVNNFPTIDLNTNLHVTLKLKCSRLRSKARVAVDSVYQGVHACEV